MIRNAMLGLIFLVGMGMVACNSSSDANGAGGDTTQGSDAPETSGLFNHENFYDKYNEYIDFANIVHDRVQSCYDYYYRDVDAEQPISEDNRPYSILTIEYDSQVESLKEMAKQKPAFENIDDKVGDITDKIYALYELLKEAETYYDRQDFKDDNFARANEMHPSIDEAFDAYYTAYFGMKEEFNKLENAVVQNDLNQMKEEGYLVRYNLLASILAAENVIGRIHNSVNDAGEVEGLNLDSLDMGFQEFRDRMEELEELSKDEGVLEEEGIDGGMSSFEFDQFMDASNDFIREYRAFKERVTNNDWEYSITHPSIPDEGSVEKISDIYSEMISSYNSVIS